ncbi:iron ABC transporter permease [Paracoccus halophilus]|uniref:Iron ABC transporter permease n=1 Tax=Paracoccus halophilus TaxID=376733 RepID=A0A099F5E2_9RHOB|nr:iron ABC transporter permease [Paracoccus halophilus]
MTRRRVQPKPARDEVWQRGLIVVIIAYLFFGLVMPLAMVFTKSLQTYAFYPEQVTIAFQMPDGSHAEPRSLQDWLDDSGAEANDGLRASERTRIQIVRIIPKNARADVESFRVTDLSADGGQLLIDGVPSEAGQSYDVPRAQLGKVQVRPQVSYGLGNYGYYFSQPSLFNSILNSFIIAMIVVVIVVPLAFGYAYGIMRTRMRGKAFFRLAATVPVLVPSLLPAIGLIYLFGNQGILTPLLMGQSIYGPIGIVMASVFFTFPHAMIIMIVALSTSDQRLYEASEVLGASKWRTFWVVTIPGARYGLISAAFVVFTLVLTDFGVPKVVGGDFNMLALDIYKQVIGQQNFQVGAVVSMVLLVPAVVAFAVDRIVSRRQVAIMSAKAVPFQPEHNPRLDSAMLILCSVVAVFILGILAMCQFAALARFWPYNLTPGLSHYDFSKVDGGGWGAYFNSLKLAVLVSTIGAAIVFLGANMVEKARGFQIGRTILQFLSMMPMAIPGMVLGLAYIFFFNDPANPLHFLYGTMAILVINTSIHLWTVSHLTASTALKQMDKEFEAVAMSLKQPFWRMLSRVSAPVCLPAISEIWLYYFVNAMTTVSAVVFLYSPQTQLASIAVLNMDDAGDIAPAAAMGMMIFYTNALVRILYSLATGRLMGRLQAWRHR